MSSVQKINKGVDRPVVFRGLQAQYIWWLAGGLVGCLLLFALLYLLGIGLPICSAIILVGGVFCFRQVYQLNRKYGEHGMMKKMARQAVPKRIKMNGGFSQ
nr:DUF4133 domain-containing protein [uncultured Sediminibacterium sp.]